MKSWAVRIILPDDGIDELLELDAFEHSEIVHVIRSAQLRFERQRQAEEQRKRAAEEQMRARASEPRWSEQKVGWEEFAEAMGRMRNWSGSFTFGRTGSPPQRPSTPRTVHEALAVLQHYTGATEPEIRIRTLVRRAKRTTHPDTGGTAADFHLVTAAEDILRRNHHI